MSLWFSASAVSGQYRALWGLSDGRGRVAHHGRAARLRGRDRRRRGAQPRRRAALALVFRRLGAARRRRQLRARGGRQLSRRAGLPLSHRGLPGRRLPAGDEDGRELVPHRPRPRDRDDRRRAHGGEGAALSGSLRRTSPRFAPSWCSPPARRWRRRCSWRRDTGTARTSFPDGRSPGGWWPRSRATGKPGSPPSATWATCGSSTRCGPGCRRFWRRAPPCGPRRVIRCPRAGCISRRSARSPSADSARSGAAGPHGGWGMPRSRSRRWSRAASAASRPGCSTGRSLLLLTPFVAAVGLLRGGRLGPVQRHGLRGRAAARRRHRAHAADVARIPPHDGHHPAGAGARRRRWDGAWPSCCWRSGRLRELPRSGGWTGCSPIPRRPRPALTLSRTRLVLLQATTCALSAASFILAAHECSGRAARRRGARVCRSRISRRDTRRIALAAGVNEITLFRHFGSKDALLREALARCQDPHSDELLPETPVDPDGGALGVGRVSHHRHAWAPGADSDLHGGVCGTSRVVRPREQRPGPRRASAHPIL